MRRLVIRFSLVATFAAVGCAEQAGNSSGPSPEDAAVLVEQTVGADVEEMDSLTGYEARLVELKEDSAVSEPDVPIWYTAVDCTDGSQKVDQVWVRDSQGTVQSAAISFAC